MALKASLRGANGGWERETKCEEACPWLEIKVREERRRENVCEIGDW